MRHILTVIILTSLLVFSACSSVDCPVENTVETVYHLYGSDGERITLLDTLTISTTRQNHTDTILLNRGVELSEFRLPISYVSPEDTLTFAFTSADAGSTTIVDKVYIAKTNEPQFESIECHIAYFHTITDVRWTNNLIDSIGINKASVNYDASTAHFHLYLKTQP